MRIERFCPDPRSPEVGRLAVVKAEFVVNAEVA
jgi:hypothetical protein